MQFVAFIIYKRSVPYLGYRLCKSGVVAFGVCPKGIYIMLVLALFDCEGVNGHKVIPEDLWHGILQTHPLMSTLTVEKGSSQCCRRPDI